MAAFSDNDYDSDSYKRQKTWDRETLCSIFKHDNVNLLKEALKELSPRAIYKLIEDGCLADCEYEPEPYNSINCFKYLIKRGLKINTKDSDGFTPLHYACMFNHRAILYILRKGGNPDSSGKHGETPIRLYIHNGGTNLEVIKEAINRGFDVESTDYNGESLIHSIQSYDEHFLPLLDLFINNGFDINIKDDHGNTFLHGNSDDRSKMHHLYVNRRKINETLIRELHKRGFDFNAKNKKEVSVIDSFKGYPNIEEMKELVKQLDYDKSHGDIKDPGCD